MGMFLVTVYVPFIGEHKWTAWVGPRLAIVEAVSEEEASEKIQPFLPPKDPEVVQALWEQDKRTEYYDIETVPLLERESGVYPITEYIQNPVQFQF